MSARPIRETDEHIAAELALAERVAERWNCTYVRNPPRYPLDYTLWRDGKLHAWAEFKCRRKQFDPFMVGASKVIAARHYAREFGLPCFLVVDWKEEGAHWVDLRNIDMGDVRYMGRSDRGDWQDMEPCVMIPLAGFRKLWP